MMFVAAGALFFALVCPLAVTPMPVGKVKRISDAAAAPAVPLPVMVATDLHEVAPAIQASPEVPPAEIPDLICVRTC